MALLELEKLRKDINILFGYVRCLMNKDAETSLLSATEWSPNHSVALGNPYLKDSLVWFNKNIYKSLTDNNIYPPTNTTYWLSLGPGHLLLEEQADWNSTTGRPFIKNKPTNTSDFTNDGQDGSSPYATLDDVTNSIPSTEGLDETLAAGSDAPDKSANIGELGLWDDFDAPTTTPGFAKIYADKGRFYFKDKAGAILAYIRNVGLNFTVGSYSFDIRVPNSIGAGRTATFQDASGTVAYLSDVSTPTLDEVLEQGSSSTRDASIGALSLYDASNSYYHGLFADSDMFHFTNTDGNFVASLGLSQFILYKTDIISARFSPALLTSTRDFQLPDASGTIALISNLPYKYINTTQSIGSDASGETELIKVTIPANSFKSSDKFHFRFGLSKTGIINPTTIRAKISTSPSMPIAGASVIATGSIGTTALYCPVERTMVINGGVLKGFPFASANVSDSATTTTAWSSVAFDVTQTQYFYISATPAAITTDVSYLEYLEISSF